MLGAPDHAPPRDCSSKLMKNKINVIFSTCPDPATARRLGVALVEDGLAACVNVVPGLVSIYRWQGATQEDNECLMVIKTTAARVEALTEWLQARHPYELPEIVAVPVTAGLVAYLDWISNQTEPAKHSA